MKACTLLNLLLAFLLASPVWPGTTGKIAGTVVDNTTGEPLPGANIVIVNSSLGAAADLEGQFTILHIPPGTYELEVSMIGYAKVTISAVRVNIDQTAFVEVKLNQESIAGEEVTIIAERNIVKPDVATSVVAITNKEVESLPVSNIEGVISQQAGIQGGLNIRGSDGENALFLLDGVTLRDPRNNEPVTKVALSAVQEISVERGGFNAEYGQVQSGIVNVVTREGSRDKYHFSLQTRVSPPAPKYYRGNGIPDVHDPDSYWMRPYLDDDVAWTGTDNGAWDTYTRMEYPSFSGWNEISDQLLTDNNPNNDLTPAGAQRLFMYETRKQQPNSLADYDIDAGFGGPVPFISEKLGDLRFFSSYRKERDVLLWPHANPDYSDYDWTLQLVSDITPSMKLRISNLAGSRSTLADNWNYGVYTRDGNSIANGTGGNLLFNQFSDWALSESAIRHRSHSAKLTHTISPKSFYEISAEYFQRDYDTGPTGARDTTKILQVVPGYWVDEYPLGYWPSQIVGLATNDGVQASLARDFSSSKSFTFKADFTSQLNFNNLAKAGVEVAYNDLDLDYGFIQIQTQARTYANRVQMRNKPLRMAAYIQDKLETQGFTMNAGLRLDYSDSRTDWWNIDPYDQFFITSKFSEDREFEMKSSKGQLQLSPRLGIAHPITENSKLFFNYGHFKQIPQYETLFRIQRSGTNSLNDLGDPNLTLAKTISYELGYDHVIFSDYLVQLAAFYRDIIDQQNETTYISINGDQYDLTTTTAYEDIRGFELTVRKTYGQWLAGFVNYTYQVTSRGHFGPEELYQDPSSQKNYNEDTSNLYQERPIPTPYARANLSFFTPGDFGPAGGSIFGDLTLNLLLRWDQGGYTTYNPKGASGITNNIQHVNEFDAQLRVGKTFRFNRFRMQAFADIYNLFNRLRLRNGVRDNQQYRQSLHLPESDAYDNIPGNDKLGDYRKPGVEWQPMEYRAVVNRDQAPTSIRPIYYEGATGIYWQYVEGQWTEVSQGRLNQINEDKAYIFNSGPSTYWFLNPRQIFFGIRVSYDFN